MSRFRDRTEKVSANLLWRPTAAAASGENIFSATLNPGTLSATSGMSGGTKLAALAALFQYFRFSEVSFKLLEANYQPNPAAIATTVGVVGFAAQSASSPTTFTQAMDLLDITEVGSSHAVVNVNSTHMPSVPKWKSVQRSKLLDQMTKWWKCELSGGIDDEFERQGALYAAILTDVASFTVRPTIQISVVCEFKNFTGTDLVPLALERRERMDVTSLSQGYRQVTARVDDRYDGVLVEPAPLADRLLRSGYATPLPLQGRK